VRKLHSDHPYGLYRLQECQAGVREKRHLLFAANSKKGREPILFFKK
jgi:hypothetical protein